MKEDSSNKKSKELENSSQDFISEEIKLKPHIIYNPKLSIDGDHWCALYGENLQEGVSGFGKSPEEAMEDFDKEWRKK